MGFRFSLEALYHLRQSLERQQEMLLYEANRQVRLLEQQLENLAQQIAVIAATQSVALQSGTRAAEIHFHNLRAAALEGQRTAIRLQVAEAQNLRQLRMGALHEARRQREVIESLRNRQREEYFREETRRSQRQSDDLFLLRRAYAGRG